jgi:ectoine hydroxylase-related dioxygenase (phytanoyl-CoA dioxygenase family)
MEVYNEVMRLEPFHSLAHDPALLSMFKMLLGEQSLVHARNIARIIFPQNTKFTTPAHQDYVHIQGTPETWTAWKPLGDCPRDLGALAVMPRSHKSGIFPVHSAYGAGGLGIDTDSLPYGWATTDFKVGDVVIFHSHTVHKALPNLSPDRIRLSADFRYQGLSQPVTQGCFQPHHAQISWEEVYAGWKSTQFQYYWRDLPLNFAAWTPEYQVAAKKPVE